ncbi:hypothetical protein SBADM41S_02900 [Streptomyces badius]
MNGGRITPNTGDPRHYEGVQNSGLKEFWHPEDALRDADKKLGFPRIDGFLEAALRTVNSPGLRLPWYSTIGNHDDLAGGVYSLGHNFYADFATGKRKLEIIPSRRRRAAVQGHARRGRPQGRPDEGAAGRARQGHAHGHPRRAPRALHPDRVPGRAPGPGRHRPRPGRPRLHRGQPRAGHPLLLVPGLRERDRHQPGHHRPGRPLHRVARHRPTALAGADPRRPTRTTTSSSSATTTAGAWTT